MFYVATVGARTACDQTINYDKSIKKINNVTEFDCKIKQKHT